NEFEREAAEAARSAKARAKSYLTLRRFADAKRVLTDGQRFLRDLKREVAAIEGEVRAWYRQERVSVKQRGQFAGLITSSESRARAARRRQIARRDLAQRQHDDIEPYRRVRTRIDEFVSSLDREKANIDRAKADSRAGVTIAPEWLPDLSGRHELRFW